MRFLTKLKNIFRRITGNLKRRPSPDDFFLDFEPIHSRVPASKPSKSSLIKKIEELPIRKLILLSSAAFAVGFFLFFAIKGITGTYKKGQILYRNEILKVLNKSYYLYVQGNLKESERLLSSLFDKELPPDLKYEAGMRLATVYLDEGKYSLAELTLLKIRDLGKKRGEYHALLGEVYFRMGRLANAREEFEKALKYKPADSVKLNYALVLMKVGEYERAITVLSSIKKPSPEALYNLALAYYKAGAMEAALNTLKRIKIEAVSDLALKKNILLLESMIHTERGDIGESLTSLEKMHEEFRDDPDVLYNLGMAYLKSGDIEKAYQILSRAFELKRSKKIGEALIKVSLSLGMKEEALKVYRAISKGDAGLLFEYANLLYQSGEPKKALKVYMEALDVVKDSDLKARILANLGSLNDYLGNSREAVSYLKKALQLRDDPVIRYNLALALKNAGRTVEAIEQLRKVVQSSPHLIDAWRLLARLLSVRGDQKQALVVLQRGLKFNPESSVLHLELARMYKSLGLLDKALTEYDLASSGSVRLVSLLEKGVLLMNMGRFNDAVRVLVEAVKQFPDSPEAHYDLALAYIKIGYLTFAEDELRQAKELTKDKTLLSKIYSSLGHIEYKKGNLEQAKAYYEKALSLDPTNANARANYRIIKRELEMRAG